MAEHDLHSVAFPTLDEGQLASLGRCPLTTLNRYRDGETRFEAGDRDFTFFVVKSGGVEIRDDSGEMPKTVAVLAPGEFTGDVSQVTGGPAIVSGVARGDCEVYEVSPDARRCTRFRRPSAESFLAVAAMGEGAEVGGDYTLPRSSIGIGGISGIVVATLCVVPYVRPLFRWRSSLSEVRIRSPGDREP